MGNASANSSVGGRSRPSFTLKAPWLPRDLPKTVALLSLLGAGSGCSLSAQAQSIRPDTGPGNLGTKVTLTEGRYDITGGTPSNNNANLFHSFQRFGLGEPETARFIADPAVQNILGRITGGNASVIQGTLEVLNDSGTVRNLVLMNPAGILFGNSATVNVPGTFTATTATGVRLGEGNWFYAQPGNNAVQMLNDSPDGFAFEVANGVTDLGRIIVGGLSLPLGRNLTLVGGQVSLGELSLPGVNVNLVAVGKDQRVIVSKPGQVLEFDIRASDLAVNSSNRWTLNPQLLAGSGPDQEGAISTGLINTASQELGRPGGNVAIAATGTIKVGNIDTSHRIELGENSDFPNESGIFGAEAIAGQVTVISTQGRLLVGDIVAERVIDGDSLLREGAFGFSNITARGGNISLRAGIPAGSGLAPSDKSINHTIQVGNVSAAASSRNMLGAAAAEAGDIRIESEGSQILTGTLKSQATAGGYTNTMAIAGDVTLETASRGGRIAFETIDSSAQSNFAEFADSESQELRGGNVKITALGQIQGNGEIIDNSESLSASIPLPTGLTIRTNAIVQTFAPESSELIELDTSGTISLTHDGGPDNLPFNVGVAEGGELLNGTRGNLQAGAGNTLTNRTFPVEAAGSSETEGKITITALNQPPSLTSLSSLTNSGEAGETFSVSYEELALTFADQDLDRLSLQVEAEDPSWVKVDGAPLENGASFGPGQVLSYTLPSNREPGEVLDVFGIRASDGAGTSEPLTYRATIVAGEQPDQPELPAPPIPKPPPAPEPQPEPNPNPPVLVVDPGASNPSSPKTDLESVTAEAAVSELIEAPPKPNLPPEAARVLSSTAQGETGTTASQASETKSGEGAAGGPQSFNPYASSSELKPIESLEEAAAILQTTEQAAGVKPALVYIQFVPKEVQGDRAFADVESGFSEDLIRYFRGQTEIPPEALSDAPLPPTSALAKKLAKAASHPGSDELEILVVMPSGAAIRKRLPGVTRDQVTALANRFRQEVTDRRKLWSDSYLASGQQLYDLLIRPIEGALVERKIENLSFILDRGLRSLPMAALHDGQGFLVERYSMGLMPSLSLADTRYVDVRNTNILAMGASEFESLAPLPAVESELELLTKQLWKGKAFFNERFTLQNLTQARASTPYGIVHLATHGEFKAGRVEDSYIQLWDQKLQLHQLEQLGFNNPPLELLVLSACQTALGDEQAELGFAGLAVKSGAKSALGSLWYVSDLGTLALVGQFYEQLGQVPVKAEALRQAQLSLIRNQTTLAASQTRGLEDSINLAALVSEQASAVDLSHPYYWSAFTLVGNPW